MELCLYSYMRARRGGQQLYLFLLYAAFTDHPFRVMRAFYPGSRIKSRTGNISLLKFFLFFGS